MKIPFVIGACLVWMVPGFAAVPGAASVEASGGACASTPEAAVRAFEAGTKLAGAEGYRVASLRRDAVLGMNWAAVERCGHPGWPAIAVPTTVAPVAAEVTGSGGVLASVVVVRRAPLVRVGETVRLWQEDRNVRLQLPAVSEQNGAAGERIRLHVGQQGGETLRTVFGLVRGPGDVEMER